MEEMEGGGGFKYTCVIQSFTRELICIKNSGYFWISFLVIHIRTSSCLEFTQ